jgi:hypothetical protein
VLNGFCLFSCFSEQYKRYGCEESDFLEAFELVQTIVDEYSAFMIENEN